MKYKNYLLVFIVLVILTVISFGNLPKTFFQQDEWQYFGAYISALSSTAPILNVILPYQGELTHFFPFGQLLFFMEFILFGINFSPYAYVGLFFHFINSVLVYFLIKKITKKEVLAVLTSVLFITNSISHQPATWILAGLGTLPSTIFILLSVIFFINFIEENKKKDIAMSIFLLLIALLFKEIALFLFFLYPLMWFLICEKKENIIRASIKPFLVVFGTGFLYFLFRLALIIYNIRGSQPETTDQSAATVVTYIYRFITVAFRGMPQSFIPQGTLVQLSDITVHLAYPQFLGADGVANPYIAQSMVLDFVCYLLSALILLISLGLFLYFKKNEKKLEKVLIFGFLLIGTSLLPFIFVAGPAGYYSIFEPRNLYIAMIGSSLIISLFSYFLASLITKNKVLKNVISISLVAPLLLFNITTVRNDIVKLELVGQLRKFFLEEIQGKYPSLPSPVVFYTESDMPYYGMPEEEKILPAQSGFGRMLMIWYQTKERFPSCLYEDQFLYGLLAQGYRFCEGRGFGYFREYDKLINAIRGNNIPENSVIAYSWNGKTKEFTDITKQIGTKIKKDTYETAK